MGSGGLPHCADKFTQGIHCLLAWSADHRGGRGKEDDQAGSQEHGSWRDFWGYSKNRHTGAFPEFNELRRTPDQAASDLSSAEPG